MADHKNAPSIRAIMNVANVLPQATQAITRAAQAIAKLTVADASAIGTLVSHLVIQIAKLRAEHLPPESETVGQAARRMYGDATYDYALPQTWVNACREYHGIDVCGNFVWLYPEGNLAGIPAAITIEGVQMLHTIHSNNILKAV